MPAMKLNRFCLAACLGSAAALSALSAAAQSPVPPAAPVSSSAALPPLQGAKALMDRIHRAKDILEISRYLTNHSAAQFGLVQLQGAPILLPFVNFGHGRAQLTAAENTYKHKLDALLSRYSLTESQMETALNSSFLPPSLAVHGRQFLKDAVLLNAASLSVKHSVPQPTPSSNTFPTANACTFHVISLMRVEINLVKHPSFDMAAQLEGGQWYLDMKLDSDDTPSTSPQSPAAARVSAFIEAIREEDAAGVEKGLQENPGLANQLLAFRDKRANADQYPALLQAAIEGNRKIVLLLLQAGAGLRVASQQGTTPLEAAAQAGDKEMGVLLLAHGANVNAADRDGQTALEEAVLGDNRELAALLLAHGANVNQKDAGGRTPLHQAAFRGDTRLITLLIKHGAILNVRDEAGETPLVIALSMRPVPMNRAVVSQLRGYGARQ